MSNSKRRQGRTSRLTNVLFATTCLAVLAGCATRLSVEEASGESARLEFRVLDNQMPSPMLYWQESPWHIETALILEPPLQDCTQVRMYANRSHGLPVELSSDAVDIQPVQLATQAEEMSAWEKITESRCALLVTVGEISEDDFIGISVSIPGKIIRRHGIGLQDDVAAKNRWWGMVPIAALFDVTHIPLYYAIGLIGSTSDDPVEPVTVIFQFPDGSRKVAILYSDEVKRLLKDNFPAVLSQLPFALKRVRTWARAAIVKLRVEFTEEAGGEQLHDEWIPDSLRLKMVAGFTGNWVYRLDTAAETSDDLTFGMGNASSIRFELASDTDP